MNFDPMTYLAQVGAQSLGFDPGPPDGVNGPRTRAAVAAFAASRKTALEAVASPPGRQINAAGLELVKHFEGLFLEAYLCPADVWTIGFGHTGLTHKDGTVFKGRKITAQDAEDLLRYDLRKFCARVVDAVKVPLNDNQFAALVSFDFNTGGLLKSTLLKVLNAGNYAAAANEFLKWDKAGGRVLAGLTRRRKSERNLFLGHVPAIVR